jgi:excisionase family DNA binding protein
MPEPKQTSTIEPLLSSDDVAEILGCTVETARSWITKTRTPVIRLGRRMRIRRADFDKILERKAHL